MGQAVRKSLPLGSYPQLDARPLPPSKKSEFEDDFESDEDSVRDLSDLPPEVALSVLSHLNATDLCLAACVWQQLASDEILWSNLCRRQWGEASIYHKQRRRSSLSSKRLYLLLDEGTLTFNSDPKKGMAYFFDHGLVDDTPVEIAKFFHHTSMLSKTKMRQYLEIRHDVIKCMTAFQNYENTFLPNALRRFFAKLEAPNDRGRYLQELLNSFAIRFCQCNPHLGYSVDSIYVLCFSLILLSVDLGSPHVKNKMTKREFIRNTRNAVAGQPPVGPRGVRAGDEDASELLGEMYDNVFLRGHVSGEGKTLMSQHLRFIPGYLAIFL